VLDPLHLDNHYLPRMYLKPWESVGGKVWTNRILVPHNNVPLWKDFSSKSVAHHLHLYTQIVAGQETDESERWFDREFESPAKEPLTKVVSNARLTADDWKRLVRFLAAQDLRTPASFFQKMKGWNESLPGLLSNIVVLSKFPLQFHRLRCRPDFVSGIPIKRDNFPLAEDRPSARFHENENPNFLIGGSYTPVSFSFCASWKRCAIIAWLGEFSSRANRWANSTRSRGGLGEIATIAGDRQWSALSTGRVQLRSLLYA